MTAKQAGSAALPFRKQDYIELTVEGFGAQGEGVCRAQGVPVFVAGALPGERILAQIVKTEKRFAFGRIARIIEASAQRCEPACIYYKQCGGCVCQHMRYEAQLQFKHDQVQSCMQRIAGIDAPVLPVQGMENPWHYRNKAAMPVAGETGSPRIGYYAQRSHRLIDIGRCLITSEAANAACEAVREWMRAFHIAPYREETHSGLVRHVMTRVNRAGALMLVLVINGRELPQAQALLQRLQKAVPTLVSLCVSSNTERGNVILGKDYRVLWGAERLQDTLCGSRFDLSPLSFFQVNPPQAERLYETALAMAGLRGTETVADLYCGAGTISLLAARYARQVIGIEVVPDAVRDARRNAANNCVKNVDFFCGEAERLLPDMAAKGLRPEVVILDPPRKGAAKAVLDAIGVIAPQRIVYISCNPPTQARDAALLCAQGYRAVRCQPVDMFCQTAGIENVMLLEK